MPKNLFLVAAFMAWTPTAFATSIYANPDSDGKTAARKVCSCICTEFTLDDDGNTYSHQPTKDGKYITTADACAKKNGSQCEPDGLTPGGLWTNEKCGLTFVEVDQSSDIQQNEQGLR